MSRSFHFSAGGAMSRDVGVARPLVSFFFVFFGSRLEAMVVRCVGVFSMSSAWSNRRLNPDTAVFFFEACPLIGCL